tara:strand:+ start:2514 stop:3098 length:585 start_codon:yes stop_codon:yes gene_type:complete
MEIILHRINSIELLKSSPKKYGIEFDIRSYGKELIINHDPFKGGTLFLDWIKSYNHGTLVINLKEDGLEEKIIFYLKKYKINSYFFLDQLMPSIINTTNKGELNCAVRVSDYESMESAINLKNKVNWVWVDIFQKFPLNKKKFIELKQNNFKICLASPEIQPHNSLHINDIKNILKKEEIFLDAVCTKFPEQWI